MKKRKIIAEPYEATEQWFLTFNDMMTLILTFFVLLLSMCSIDIKLLQGVQREINDAFGLTSPVWSQKTTGDETLGALAQLKTKSSIAQHKLSGSLKQSEDDAEISGIAEALRAIFKVPVDEKGGVRFNANDTAGTTHKFKGVIDDAYYEPGIALQRQKRGVVLRLPAGILFQTADATLSTRAYPLLDAVAAALAKTKLQIYIEGHTDALPIATAPYASNTELSVARSATVAQYLMERHRVAPDRIGIAGYGDAVPLMPNDTEAHRAANRRVEIVFARN